MITLGDGASDAMLMVEDELEQLYLGEWDFDAKIPNWSDIMHYPTLQNEPTKPVHPEVMYYCRGCRNDILGKYLSPEAYCPECQSFADKCAKYRRRSV